MKKLELLTRLCDLVDVLQSQVLDLDHTPPRYALEALEARFEVLLDDLVERQTEALEDDETPCPHCGEGACEASCTAALVAQAGLPSGAGWRQTPAAC